MIFLQLRIWRLGVKSLLLHPLRSMLTVLGIFIGVASVVWLLAIGEGISREAQRQIEELGATNIILRSILPVEESMGDTTFYVKYGIRREEHTHARKCGPRSPRRDGREDPPDSRP